MNTPDVFDAIDKHDIKHLWTLLQQGTDVNIHSLSGRAHWTPLQLAVDCLDDGGPGPRQMIELLIQSGADVNLWHPDSSSPLVMAISRGYDDIALLLLEVGADPNKGRYEGGKTPLRISVEKGDIGMAKVLIDFGAAKTIDEPGGYTGKNVLGVAIQNLDVPMVKLLLDAGADPEAIDWNYRKPIEWLPKEDGNSLKEGIKKMIEDVTRDWRQP